MRIRLYYRFKGVPVDRPGGPWWYRDFDGGGEARDYAKDVGPFVEEIQRVMRGDLQPMPQHDPMEISPPTDAESYEVR